MSRLASPQHTLLSAQLDSFSKNQITLKGIKTQKARDTLVQQIIDSIRRIEYVYRIASRNISNAIADPNNPSFDPLKAAIFNRNAGHLDEAFWLTFVAIHFGKSDKTGWQLAKSIYSSAGEGETWTWERISKNPANFSTWYNQNHKKIVGNFGNHRKYESKKPNSNRGITKVFESYVSWVLRKKNHKKLIENALIDNQNSPTDTFDYLYRSMDEVISFGRTAKFDFLTMIAKLGLAYIEPGIPYIRNSTGPIQGVKLLTEGNIHAPISPKKAEEIATNLAKSLNIGKMRMQVIEDALCNWQKSPTRYIHFSG